VDPVAAQAEQRVGEEIAGKYQLERLLGAGGMGAVYEAVHRFTHRRVAVKLMHPSFGRSKLAAERFLREAQAPGTIGHPGIVEVLDGGQDEDGSLYLVLELLEGETLAGAMKAGALDVQRLGAIALELLDALGAAHEAGFVHRDIKPDNVFLTPAGAEEPLVKLLDFGVAGVLAEAGKPRLTVKGAVLGTPLYMSPEQALGHAVDARSDLWSVGAVMYQALAGCAPFGGDSIAALLVSISQQQHVPLDARRPEVPVRLAMVVERALEKKSENRWQSAQEMAEALRSALEHARRPRDGGGPALAPPPAAVAPTTPLGERVESVQGWPWGVIAAAVLVIGLAVGVGAWTVGRGGRVAHAAAKLARPTAEVAEPSPIAEAPPRPTPGTASAPHPAATLPAAPRAAVPLPAAQQPPTAQSAPAAPVAVSPPSSAPGTVAPVRPLDSAVLSGVLQAHQPELQRCYENAVVASMGEPGSSAAAALAKVRLDVVLAIAPSGKIDRVVVNGQAPAELKQCATAAITGWTFPASDRASDLSFPVVFQRELVPP
jgi:tRNA A-37 threonylcarbamoyl transferase component Bud32